MLSKGVCARKNLEFREASENPTCSEPGQLSSPSACAVGPGEEQRTPRGRARPPGRASSARTSRTGYGRGTCAPHPARPPLLKEAQERAQTRRRPRHHCGAPLRVSSPGHCPLPARCRRAATHHGGGRSERPRGAGEARRSPAKPGTTKEVGPQRLRRAGGLFRSLWLLMATEARDLGVRNF